MTARTAPTTEEIRAEIAQIDARLDELTTRRKDLIAHLAQLPAGSYDTPAGGFVVRPPSRSFDHKRAFESLPKASQALCVGPIAALVKAQIPPAALDAFMVATPGASNVVTIK